MENSSFPSLSISMDKYIFINTLLIESFVSSTSSETIEIFVSFSNLNKMFTFVGGYTISDSICIDTSVKRPGIVDSFSLSLLKNVETQKFRRFDILPVLRRGVRSVFLGDFMIIVSSACLHSDDVNRNVTLNEILLLSWWMS